MIEEPVVDWENTNQLRIEEQWLSQALIKTPIQALSSDPGISTG